jgi:deoxycytidylate deaminase
MKYNLNKKRCAKQTTVAIIENNGEYWLGTNSCKKPQVECPRGNMPSGEGYVLCEVKCEQEGHAEIMALKAAGKKAAGGTLFLMGHVYICDNCRNALNKAGIKNTIIVKDYRGEISRNDTKPGDMVPSIPV